MSEDLYGCHKIKCSPWQARFYFDYDPISGSFEVSGRSLFDGDPNTPRKSCVRKTVKHAHITWLGTRMPLHRFVWMMYYGDYPFALIDHINGDGFDNRIANLREVSASENSQNRRNKKAPRSGLTGAFQEGSRFVAKIRANNKVVRLGTFSTAEEAHGAYMAAKKVMHISDTDLPAGKKTSLDMQYLLGELDYDLEEAHLKIKQKLDSRGVQYRSANRNALHWSPVVV